MTEFTLNTLTAKPLLEYLVACEGVDDDFAGGITPARAWPAFSRFAAIPTTSDGDVISFQASWVDDPTIPPAYTMSWARELTDDASGFGRSTLSVILEFRYEVPPAEALHPIKVWSTDFPSIEGFLAEVERCRAFQFAQGKEPDFATIYRQVDAAERTDRDASLDPP
ncbi:MAG: hypothetical protein ABI647_12495 [Gemmatimonadota bacterium]